jgi:hypothetical protein
MEKKKTGIIEIVEIKSGFIIMVYRNSGLHFRVVAMVDPLALTFKTIERELGKESSVTDEEKTMNNLFNKRVLFKKFKMIIIQPKTRRIIGVIDDRAREEIIFRVIGFINPKGLEKKYKVLLAEKDITEEVPYYEYFGLGREWKGTRMSKDDAGITLFNLTKPVTKVFPVESIF